MGGGGTWCEATTEVKFVVGLTTYNVWLYARNTTKGRGMFWGALKQGKILDNAGSFSD